MLAFFEKEEMISVVAERRKGTLITVLNYAEYAEKIASPPAHNAAHMPAHNEASNTKALGAPPAHIGEHKAAHHEQEYKNKNTKKTTSENSIESPDTPSKQLPVLRPDAAIQSPKGDKWGTADDLKAAEWMFCKVVIVAPTAQEPNWPAWSNDIRLMRNAMKVSHHEICELFKWANADHFWQTNVMSPAKLREKWDTLKAQMNQTNRNRQAPEPQQPAQHWNSRDAWENEFL